MQSLKKIHPWAQMQVPLYTTSVDIKIVSRNMSFPTMWYVRPAKPQISLRIRAV